MNRGLPRLITAGVLTILFLTIGCGYYKRSGLSTAGPSTETPVPPLPPLEASAPAPSMAVVAAPGVNSGMIPGDVARMQNATNTKDRLMVYDASMILVVQDITGSLDKLRAMAASLTGYMQEMTGNSIVLRVPAVRFNEALQTISKLGEITSQQIKGSDVTEEMRDLDIRLKNMEQVRERLLKLLDKGDKVEDLLKVSQELERVTEAIELLKGKIQYLQNQIAYSTLRIVLNSPVPQKELAEVVPFAWVRALASEIMTSAPASFEPERHMFSWLKFDLPASYVKLLDRDNCTRAMSGDGVMLIIKREPNFEGGTLDFWTRIVRRWIVASGVIAVTEEKDVTLDNGAKGRYFVGTKTFGRKQYQYQLALIARKDFVYTFECWGPAEPMSQDQEALAKTLKSLRIKP